MSQRVKVDETVGEGGEGSDGEVGMDLYKRREVG